MENYGIVVSQPNGNGTSKVIFTTQYPFAKLDTLNPVSFQNIEIIFNHDPPEPDGVSNFYQVTMIYQFPHGYTYIPTVWGLFQRVKGTSTQDGSQPNRYSSYAYENSVIAASSDTDNANFANLLIGADDQNIYITVEKLYATSQGNGVNLVGYQLLLRIYVFVEPLIASADPS